MTTLYAVKLRIGTEWQYHLDPTGKVWTSKDVYDAQWICDKMVVECHISTIFSMDVDEKARDKNDHETA